MRLLALAIVVSIFSSNALAEECHFNVQSAMISLKQANSTRTIKRSLQHCSKNTLNQIEQDIQSNLKRMMTNKVESSEDRSQQRYQFQANYYLLSLIRNYLEEV